MLDPVTIRYTEALFNLARSEGELDRVRQDVERFAAELERPGVAAFVFDARVSMETRREKIRPFFAGASQLFSNFVDLLFDKRREEVLRELAQAFHRRVLQEQGGAEGVVESATELDATELARISQALEKRLRKRITLSNRVVPELIGGVRVIVDNKMMDLSLRGRLEGLRKRMLEAPLSSKAEA